MARPIPWMTLIWLFFSCWGMTVASEQPRSALVIGNAAYRHVPPLVNTLNDAHDIATDLRQAGFQVTEVHDADLATLIDTIDKFVKQLHQAGGVGLLYYSGHGIQVDGRNYLAPIDVELKNKSRIKYEAFALDDAIAPMGGRGGGAINLVILDACRDNPFAASRGTSDRGLARVEAPESTLILYATKPGQTADDNPQGRNGLFTKHLRHALQRAGVNVEMAFSEVVKRVYEESGQKQYPWKEGVLLNEFQFLPGSSTAMPSEKPSSTDNGAEVEFWRTAKESNQIERYQAYLNRYPQGIYAEAARLQIRSLTPQSQPTRPQLPPKSAASYSLSLVKSVSASSELAPQRDAQGRGYTYSPRNAMDGNPDTAWVEGVGNSSGQWWQASFRQPVLLRAVSLVVEYKGKKNDRLKRVRLMFSNGLASDLVLQDTPARQRFQFNQPQTADWVRLEIQAVYPGTRFTDTPLAEVEFE